MKLSEKKNNQYGGLYFNTKCCLCDTTNAIKSKQFLLHEAFLAYHRLINLLYTAQSNK